VLCELGGCAERSGGKRATRRKFGHTGSEFDSKYGDTARAYGHATCRDSNPSGENRHTADSSESEYPRRCAGIQLTEQPYARKQHATFYGESEHANDSGNYAGRIALRIVARHSAGDGGSAEWFAFSPGIDGSIYTESGIIAVDGKQPGRKSGTGTGNPGNDAVGHTVPTGRLAEITL
jgi:hypothetical protein